ncbi:Olfactory receptor 7A10 [Sciurus carolinensis]|uniref:Olfactory receptor 7A10 n=1 Tax=Sciurus carolinensis TaxID=30640 RepID=A0AA41NCI6_SCICA|nr:Olfactory receptor 7A10 [Sciurus carolinensis]
MCFCTHLELPHFFCELNQVVLLSCSATFPNDRVMYVFCSRIAVLWPLAGVPYSYFKKVTSVLEISSVQGRYKAFSTCASHLSIISLFYCTCLGVFFSSSAAHSSATASVMYSMVTPMLNPFIYSLRIKDITGDLKRFFCGKL